jgi:hypothetical protein
MWVCDPLEKGQGLPPPTSPTTPRTFGDALRYLLWLRQNSMSQVFDEVRQNRMSHPHLRSSPLDEISVEAQFQDSQDRERQRVLSLARQSVPSRRGQLRIQEAQQGARSGPGALSCNLLCYRGLRPATELVVAICDRTRCRERQNRCRKCDKIRVAQQVLTPAPR